MYLYSGIDERAAVSLDALGRRFLLWGHERGNRRGECGIDRTIFGGRSRLDVPVHVGVVPSEEGLESVEGLLNAFRHEFEVYGQRLDEPALATRSIVNSSQQFSYLLLFLPGLDWS